MYEKYILKHHEHGRCDMSRHSEMQRRQEKKDVST